MWRGAALLLLCLVTFVAGLGRSAITDFDEAYYAEAGREMVVGGDWITPHYNFVPRLQKPILYYWLVASTYAATGVSEFGARVWAALSGVAMAGVAYLVGSRWMGRGPGLLAGVILATSFGFVPFARQSLPDVPLALFITISTWALIEAIAWPVARAGRTDTAMTAATWPAGRWLLLAAVAMALGMLTKGPIAVALPVMAVLPLWWIEWRGRRSSPSPASRGVILTLTGHEIAIATLLFLAVALPWYVAETRAMGWDYLRQFFVGENLDRFVTSRYNVWRGWSYPPAVAGMLLPWSAFGILWLRPVYRRLTGAITPSALEVRLASWALGPLVLLMISVGSQPRYAVPCLVPVALLLGRTVWTHATTSERGRGRFALAGAIAGAITIAMAVLVYRARALLIGADPHWSPAGVGIMLTSGLLMIVAATLMPRRLLPAAVAAGAAACLLAFEVSTLEPGRPEPVEIIARAARDHGIGAKMCACGAFARSLNFYTHVETVIAGDADNDESVKDFLNAPDRVLAAVDAVRLARVERDLGRHFPRLAEVAYLNTNDWLNPPTLLNPDPGLLQRVILISNR